ncbi:hypothetical protein CVPH_0188 [Abyssogena phaseoliformis symbiont OG214]|uniref:hypothetical protein n=1 Tax=Abyssogena phaseoliformis symbiont TaxID=596095 RepID=UPI00191579B9|nr:hypothetical protein [Abyssogena phaseoliformis symbiont]MBW5289458.1 hypothetical protein [Candidatus Ruthia sp. Apha_13_S6]BBB22355.1 hypothetical protein CVPH_0188 [Abyssogena phaseoliformis symbiont OG214]
MIAINKAQELITQVLPKITLLQDAINTRGTYLIFDNIKVNNASISDFDYVFKCFVAIKTASANKALAYQPLDAVLNPLVEDWKNNAKIEIGDIKTIRNQRVDCVSN